MIGGVCGDRRTAHDIPLQRQPVANHVQQSFLENPQRPDGVGARFVGRTGIGPLAIDDPMEDTAWVPPTATTPGRCELRKLGRVVLGTASFDVAAVDGDRSLVVWDEDVEVAPVVLTRPFGALLAVAGRRAFAATIRAMGREAEAARARPTPQR